MSMTRRASELESLEQAIGAFWQGVCQPIAREHDLLAAAVRETRKVAERVWARKAGDSTGVITPHITAEGRPVELSPADQGPCGDARSDLGLRPESEIEDGLRAQYLKGSALQSTSASNHARPRSIPIPSVQEIERHENGSKRHPPEEKVDVVGAKRKRGARQAVHADGAARETRNTDEYVSISQNEARNARICGSDNASTKKASTEHKEDVSVEQQEVSLLCPLSHRRIEVPVKGTECRHVQCFDKKTWLLSVKGKAIQKILSLRPMLPGGPRVTPRPAAHDLAYSVRGSNTSSNSDLATSSADSCAKRCPICGVAVMGLESDAIFSRLLEEAPHDVSKVTVDKSWNIVNKGSATCSQDYLLVLDD